MSEIPPLGSPFKEAPPKKEPSWAESVEREEKQAAAKDRISKSGPKDHLLTKMTYAAQDEEKNAEFAKLADDFMTEDFKKS
jgi:hypothetical protein